MSDQKKKSVPAHSFPTCTKCGSDYAIRLGDPVLPDDRYDDEESGMYRCGHCRTEYMYLHMHVQRELQNGAEKCPKCSSYKTKTFSVHTVVRYHVCLEPKCQKSFKTVRPANERRSRRSELN